MTPTQHLIATQARGLIPEVAELYERALKLEQEHSAELHQQGAFCGSHPGVIYVAQSSPQREYG